MKITQYNFPPEQYVQQESKKLQIYLHHTAGNADPFGVYKDWETTESRIATCVVIGGRPGSNNNWANGEIVQGYSSKYWAWHLGIKEQTFADYNMPYEDLDEISIGVEMCNWGQLTLKNGKYYNYVNREISPENVCELEQPFKGYKYYHAYSDAQIESLRELLVLWGERYGISLDYNSDIWNMCPRALRMEPGIFTHVSVRRDKNDCSPQPKLIEMLKSLT